MGLFPPDHDELYVVSDIHMGGRKDGDRDFQIFNRGPRLAAFIDQVRTTRPQDEVALVLNGDIIDSLAEDEVPGYVALDSRTAVTLMSRLYGDPSFRPVWEALDRLVHADRRHLVLVVGNHDIELALPIVEDSIRRRLAEGDPVAQSRIAFATHGGGYACRVGGARVFCTHGNETDDWNWVDYNLLGQLANAINAGRAVEPRRWKPNAGTRLVRDVMNVVKASYPFVDLLKPEAAAVASVLMALDRDTFRRLDLTDAFPILRDHARGGHVTSNLLGADPRDLPGLGSRALADEAARQLLGPSLAAGVAERRLTAADEDSLLLAAGLGGAAAPAASAPETLGVFDVVAGLVGLVPRVEGLWRALKDWSRDDRTFDPGNADDPLYKAMQDRVADSVEFVVTGHTHLARALPFGRGGAYLNCGTWIRLLRLPQAALADLGVFERQVWPVLQSRRMADLDAASVEVPGGAPEPLLFDRTGAVRIASRGGRVTAELLRVSDGAQPGTVSLAAEPGTGPFQVGP